MQSKANVAGLRTFEIEKIVSSDNACVRDHDVAAFGWRVLNRSIEYSHLVVPVADITFHELRVPTAYPSEIKDQIPRVRMTKATLRVLRRSAYPPFRQSLR